MGVSTLLLMKNDPNIAATNFSYIFGNILNNNAPLKTFQVRNNYAPWISAELRVKMSHRDFLKLQAIDSGNVIKFEQHKVLRNNIKSELESEKVNYYRNKFYSPGMSVGSTWDAANDYLGSAKKSQSNTPSLLVDNGCIINSPRDIANAFNRIFIEKVHRINQSGLVNDVGNAFHHLKNGLIEETLIFQYLS